MDRAARLLVVDDTPQNGRLLEAMLTPHGYTVALALSGGEGLAKLHSEPPDLVLLDILMPDMTGYDVCRRIREDPATQLLPVVMLTSSGEQDKVNAIEAVSYTHLDVYKRQKPPSSRAEIRRRGSAWRLTTSRLTTSSSP